MAHRLESPTGGGVRRLGPSDQGVALGLAEFEAADFEPGFRYDLVDGRLAVSPEPNLSHDEPLQALADLLRAYRDQHRDRFGCYVSTHARVFPPASESSLGPDMALFRGHQPRAGLTWQDLQPALVVEVVSAGDPSKDLVRNRALYARIPSIREYWVVDPRRGGEETTLLVLVRDPAGGWVEQRIPAGGRHESSLLPGLVVDLSRADLGLEQLEQAGQNRVREAEARLILIRQLQGRFGPLAAPVAARLEESRREQLQRWLDRVPGASRLEDVFTDGD